MGSGTPRKRSRLRIFLAAIIMVDMLRRILGGDVRVIDLWILLVDVLILLLIFIEDLVAFARWCKKRRDLSAEEKELRERLANLESSAVEGLRNFILKGQKPSDEICSALEGDVNRSLVSGLSGSTRRDPRSHVRQTGLETGYVRHAHRAASFTVGGGD